MARAIKLGGINQHFLSIRPAEAFNVPHEGILNKPRPTLEYRIVGWGWKILEKLINRGLEIFENKINWELE